MQAQWNNEASAKQKLFAGTGIDVERVSSPDYLISLDQYYAVIASMMKLTNDPGIAFSLGDITSLNDFGIVGYAMISANSLRESLGVWLKYSDSLVGSPMHASFCDAMPGYEAILSSPSNVSAIHRFEIEEIIIQGGNMIRDMTGVVPRYSEVSFSYPEPLHRALYESLLQCPLRFDAPQTSVRILEPDLNAPIRTMNRELFNICAEHCRQVMGSISGTGMLRSRLRSLFLETPGCLPSLEQASALLGTSMRTLGRQLDEAGQNYQAIKDEFRFDLAREYLRSGHMTPKQVSYLLGFNSPSTFSRAFKTWSGKTVGQFVKSESL